MLKNLLAKIRGLAGTYQDVRKNKIAELSKTNPASQPKTVTPAPVAQPKVATPTPTPTPQPQPKVATPTPTPTPQPQAAKTISASVGKGGKNVKADVILVQQLLNKAGASLVADGDCGAKTIAAIENFQRTKVGLSKPDGRIDPGGRSWNALNGAGTTANTGGTQPQQGSQPTQPQQPTPQNQGAQSGDYSHPNAKNVKITHGANAVPLNARATALLQSLLAACNIPAATVTSTLRTYHDQARITKTQTLPSRGEATVRQWYGQAVLDATKKHDVAGLAKWWADYDKNRGKLSSLHLSGVALDVVPSKDRAKFADLVRSLTGKNGIKRIIKKGEMNEPVDHVEFTFQVTNQTPTSGSGGGGGTTTTTPPANNTTTTPPANNNPAPTGGSIKQSVGKGGKNDKADVILVQQLLNKVASAGLVPDGSCGPKTIAAIESFQRNRMGIAQPDGRVDPNGRTWNALNGNTTTTPNTGGTNTNTGNNTSNPLPNTGGSQANNTVPDATEIVRTGSWAKSPAAKSITATPEDVQKIMAKIKGPDSPANLPSRSKREKVSKLGEMDAYMQGKDAYVNGKAMVARPLATTAALNSAYGTINIADLGDDEAKSNQKARAAFASQNITTITSPFTLDVYGSRGTKISVHKHVAGSLAAALREVLNFYGEELIVKLGINQYAGGFVFRKMRGSSTASSHAWGVAVDFCHSLNTLPAKGNDALFNQPPYSAFLDIMEKYGWHNQGRSDKANDFMHFQAACY